MFSSLLDFSLTDILQTFMAFIAAQSIISQFFKSLSTSFAKAKPNDNPEAKPVNSKKVDTVLATASRGKLISLWGLLFPILGILLCAYDFNPHYIPLIKIFGLICNTVLLIIWILSYFIIEFMNMK